MTDNTTIIRASHSSEQPYFLLRRATAQDHHLSFEARGVLAYLLSKPDNWRTDPVDLQHAGNCGRDRIRRIINELEHFGYLTKIQMRDEHGQFAEWVYLVHEHPETEKTVPAHLAPETEKPSPVHPASEKQDHIYKRDHRLQSVRFRTLGVHRISKRVNEPVTDERESARSADRASAAKSPKSPRNGVKRPVDQPHETIKAPEWEKFCAKMAQICQRDMETNAGEIRSWAKKIYQNGQGYAVDDLDDFNWWWWKHDWRGAINKTPPYPNQVVQFIKQATSHQDSEARRQMREDGYTDDQLENDYLLSMYIAGVRQPLEGD